MFGDSKNTLFHKNGYEFLRVNSRENTGNLIFVHGMFGGLSNFDPLIDLLPGYTVYVPKIPLYEFKRSELSIPMLAEWLRDFIAAMQIEEPVLLGNSMGGHVVLEYIYQNPFKAKAQILTGSSGLLEYDFGSSFPRRKSREYLREKANMTFYEDLADDVIVDELVAVTNDRKKILSLLKLTRSTHSYSMENKLGDIKQPTLLVWGKQDVVTPPKVARQFHKLLPNSTLKFIDRCGHAPMMERPGAFADLMQHFLQNLNRDNHSKQKTL